MNRKINNARRVFLAVLLMMLAAVVLAACVGNLDEIPELEAADISFTSSEVVEESSQDIPTPAGHTEAPTVEDIINISPNTVAVLGYCEPGSVIRVSGGAQDVETESTDGYYIIETELKYSKNLLEITAQTEGKEESLPREFVAAYNATADTRLDGNSVSVGVKSRLYFDKMADSLSGKNLYTASQLATIKNYISNTITAYYYDRAANQDVSLIYCLIPNVTTIYPEIIPEGVVTPTNTTIYDQILSAVSETRAVVVDMREEFLALRDDETVAQYGGIYRTTDSGLTDYGAYLTYKAIMDKISVKFPDAAARDLSDFKIETVEDAKGGDLVGYRGIDNEVITESVTRLTPNFTLQLGNNAAGSSSIIALRKFVDKDNKDFNFFTKVDANDNINGVAERWLIDTKRSDTLNLPNALIYRDYASYSFADILAERFEKVVLARGGEFSINLSNTLQYAREGQNVVDYIIVILSEDSMDKAFNLAFSS